MLGISDRAVFFRQHLMMTAYTSRLIDGNLFTYRDMHAQMKKWIGLAEFRRVIAVTVVLQIAVVVLKHRVIFGVHRDHFHRHRLHRR